jgi:2-polyprenyl-3-methyl-5-hydroxy-6-metoxy-1,4-benzoquinol methylase
MNISQRDNNEIEHFTTLPHVWWGLKTVAGQKRYDNKFEILRKMCHIRKSAKILEVGCGNGEFTKRLSKIAKGDVEVVATDITPVLIKEANKNRSNKNILFKVDNLHKLSFKKNEFNIVCGISILHHVDLQKSLAEIYKVLKPGGEIFFTEPNLLNPVIYLGLHIESLRKKMEFSPDETAFIRWSLENQIKRAGFRDIKVLNYDFLHPNTPEASIPFAEKLGSFLEKVPVIKEVSGSLIVYAKK